jgi:hypothetical protein
MKADDDFLIQPPRSPEPTEKKPHKWQIILSLAALLLSLCAVVAAGVSAYYTYKQADEAHQARIEADKASAAQAADVVRSRKAAEKSAEAAQKLADGMERSAGAAEQSAIAGKESLALSRQALILSNAPSLEALTITLNKELSAGMSPVATTDIVDTGKGIAYSAKLQEWIGLAARREFTYPEVLDFTAITDIGPGINSKHTIVNDLKVPLTPEMLSQINAGKLILYVYGRAVYYDRILEKPRKYTYYWCSVFLPKAPQYPLMLRACPEHNYTVVE